MQFSSGERKKIVCYFFSTEVNKVRSSCCFGNKRQKILKLKLIEKVKSSKKKK